MHQRVIIQFLFQHRAPVLTQKFAPVQMILGELAAPDPTRQVGQAFEQLSAGLAQVAIRQLIRRLHLLQAVTLVIGSQRVDQHLEQVGARLFAQSLQCHSWTFQLAGQQSQRLRMATRQRDELPDRTVRSLPTAVDFGLVRWRDQMGQKHIARFCFIQRWHFHHGFMISQSQRPAAGGQYPQSRRCGQRRLQHGGRLFPALGPAEQIVQIVQHQQHRPFGGKPFRQMGGQEFQQIAALRVQRHAEQIQQLTQPFRHAAETLAGQLEDSTRKQPAFLVPVGQRQRQGRLADATLADQRDDAPFTRFRPAMEARRQRQQQVEALDHLPPPPDEALGGAAETAGTPRAGYFNRRGFQRTGRNRQTHRLATGMQVKFPTRRDLIAGNRQVAEVGIIGQILPGGLEGGAHGLALQQRGVELGLERRAGAHFQGRGGIDVDNRAILPIGVLSRPLQHRFRMAGAQQQHPGSG